MSEDRLQFYALYLTRFATGFGFITLLMLLPDYIDIFGASGVVVGLFTTAFTLAQTAAVVPLAWAGDRGDKRRVLAGSLALGAVAYVAFAFVGSSVQFILVRALQGVAVTGTGLMSLALVGELAPETRRANYIGKANAFRFAAGILGSIGAATLYQWFGFAGVYAVLVGLVLPALVGVWYFLDPDATSIRGNPFADLAFNRRLLTLTSFRAQYAVAVTLVRTWVPIYAGVTAASGGLAFTTLAVSFVITAEKSTNMLCQPFTGRWSDRAGRSLFVFVGGGCYGLVALAVPFTPEIGAALGLPASFPVVGDLSPAFLPLLACNGLLGVADSVREPASMALFADEGTVASSFGIRELVWRPGSVLAPMLGGVLMSVGIAVGVRRRRTGGVQRRPHLPRGPLAQLRDRGADRVVAQCSPDHENDLHIKTRSSREDGFRSPARRGWSAERVRRIADGRHRVAKSTANSSATDGPKTRQAKLYKDINLPITSP